MPSLPAKMKILLIIAKNLKKQTLNFSRSALFRMKTRVSLKYFVNDCLWKPFFASILLQTPSNVFLENFGSPKAFHTFLI